MGCAEWLGWGCPLDRTVFGSPWPVSPGWWGGHRLTRARAMGALVLILAHAAWSLRPWHCTLNSIRNLTNLINPPQPEPCKSPEQGRLSIIHLRLNDLLGPAWE